VLTGVFFNILNNPSLLSSSASDPQATAKVLSPNSVQVGTHSGPVGAGGAGLGGCCAYARPPTTQMSDAITESLRFTGGLLNLPIWLSGYLVI